MEIEFSKFCKDYAEQLEPFSAELQQAANTLAAGDSDASGIATAGPSSAVERSAGDSAASDSVAERLWGGSGDAAATVPEQHPAIGRIRRNLQETRYRAETLRDKIAQQQTYLLIFGPLKSGKSTLMNAMSGSYVSEVSSLPAYPALVHVKHGDSRRFEATTYSGDKIRFQDAAAMAEAVLQGHEELARKILETERSGRSFDPQQDYPQAIRRIDIETPAKSLANSGAVLVDTPGLYTRMRFGYDLLTRDFRDTASCAIFVVKSDNLFFEKVFEEFNQLLGHFSRIFLVVNIDSSKKDLRPDGSLQPSLESSRPEAIVDAFQSLAMSAPLREAYEDGHLNVYTIDLLKSASAQLRREAGEDVTASEEAELNRFLDDLTSYLDSSDYLQEFIYDNLRQGSNLRDEVAALVSEDIMTALEADASHWREQKRRADARLKAADTAERIDWEAAFSPTRDALDELVAQHAQQHWTWLSDALDEEIERWRHSDDSLRALQDDYLNQRLAQETANDARAVLERLIAQLDTSSAGAQFTEEQTRTLDRAGMKLQEDLTRLLTKLGDETTLAPRSLNVTPDAIALKSRLRDYLLFRKKSSVRQRLFGAEGKAPVPAAAKHKRIGKEELEPLRGRIKAYLQDELPGLYLAYVERVLCAYQGRYAASINQQSQALRRRWKSHLSDSDLRLRINAEERQVLQRLVEANRTFSQALADLKQRYDVATDAPAPRAEKEPADLRRLSK